MEENLELDFEFRIRLPSNLAKRIAEAAEKERRSKNKQYVYMLENWFKLNEQHEKRKINGEDILEDIEKLK